MSRILILIPFLLWLCWSDGDQIANVRPSPGLAAFFGFYVLLVLTLGVWGRWLARRVTARNFMRSLRRFNRMVFAARVLVPAWFGVGMFVLGWASLVNRWFHGSDDWRLSLPGVVLGTLPAFVAWMGLWWAQFPADRALREQNLLCQLEADVPLHVPPSFRSFFFSHLRLQLLFMGAPVLLVVLLHDVGTLLLWGVPLLLHREALSPDAMGNAQATLWLVATGLVFLLAPEVLRHILHTEPLPDSALRRRLDALCTRHGVRYREILLWKTDFNMGNAAVMGLVPRLRYILLSDLLLETMSDEQIEAVFAHEVGHIIHRHMSWYVLFMAALVLVNVTVGQWIDHTLGARGTQVRELALAAVAMAKFLLLFGFLSRRFERQADVFAARTIEAARPALAAVPAGGGPASAWDAPFEEDEEERPPLDDAPDAETGAPAPARATPRPSVRDSHVGAYGAGLFISALHRVAVVNNVPVAAPSWCHGSIAKRMNYLRSLSGDPRLTAQFDRFMFCLYGGLLLALGASAVLAFLTR